MINITSHMKFIERILPDQSSAEINTFELLECSYNFDKRIDEWGNPAGRLRGGIIDVVLKGSPPVEITNWCFNFHKLKSGIISTCDAEGNVLEKLSFSQAKPVSFRILYKKEVQDCIVSYLSISASSINDGLIDFQK